MGQNIENLFVNSVWHKRLLSAWVLVELGLILNLHFFLFKLKMINELWVLVALYVQNCWYIQVIFQLLSLLVCPESATLSSKRIYKEQWIVKLLKWAPLGLERTLIWTHTVLTKQEKAEHGWNDFANESLNNKKYTMKTKNKLPSWLSWVARWIK